MACRRSSKLPSNVPSQIRFSTIRAPCFKRGTNTPADREDRCGEGRSGAPPAYVVDGVRDALVPTVRVADAEQDLCAGVLLHKLFVERAAGPVHGSFVVSQKLLPVHGFSGGRRVPRLDVSGVFEDLGHVVAGIETELFERRFKGQCTRPAEAGPDHPQVQDPPCGIISVDALAGAYRFRALGGAV